MSTMTSGASGLTAGRKVFLLLFLASAGALTAALIGEKVFGLVPCILCLYERIPYAIAGAIGLALMAIPSSPRLRQLAMGLLFAIFAVSTILSFYHVGVEQHWWASPACTGGPMESLDLNDLQAALAKPIEPSCDDVQWSFMGITLAGFNLIYSMGLAVFCLLVTLRWKKAA